MLFLVTFFTHPPLIWKLSVYSLYLWVCFYFLLCFLDSTYKWNHVIFVFLWLILLNIIPFGSIHIVANGKIFYVWVIWHCMYIPHILYPFMYWWTPGLLPYVGYYKYMLQWTWRCIYLSELVFLFSLAKHSEVELLGHMVVQFFNFLRNFHTVFLVVTPIYNPTNSTQEFQFLHILDNSSYP